MNVADDPQADFSQSRLAFLTFDKAFHLIYNLYTALRESAGAWSDEDNPDLMTVEDVNRYIRQLRETWMPRSWDEIAEEAERGG